MKLVRLKFFILFAIACIMIMRHCTLEKRYDEFLKEYPAITLIDSINDRVVEISHPEGFTLNTNVVSVILESSKITINSKPNSQNVEIYDAINYNSLLIKKTNSDTIIVINESSHDTVRHYFTLYQH